MAVSNPDIIRQLQKEILPLHGFKPPTAGKAVDFQLGPIETAFPGGRFPTGAVHEFINYTPEQAAASNGFVAGLLGSLMKNGGACLWIGPVRKLFLPGLAFYGIAPEKILFVELAREKDILWAVEEALKCPAVSAVPRL